MSDDNATQEPDAQGKIQEFAENAAILKRLEGSVIFVGQPCIDKAEFAQELPKKIAGAVSPSGAATGSFEDAFKDATRFPPAILGRISSIEVVQFDPLSPKMLKSIAQKMMRNSPLAPDEQQALAEILVEKFAAGGDMPKNGIRTLLKAALVAPLTPEMQAAVVKKLLEKSVLAADQRAVLADIVLSQLGAPGSVPGKGGQGLKQIIDRTLEGPLPPDLEETMIANSPSYAAGASRRNGGKLAEACHEGLSSSTPILKRLHLKPD